MTDCEHAGDGCPTDCWCACEDCQALQAVLRGDPDDRYDWRLTDCEACDGV